jgi:beta-glucosidase
MWAVNCTVTNTGMRDGDDVLQLYVTPPLEAPHPKPYRRLVDFQRVHVAAGGKSAVSFDLPLEHFCIVRSDGTRHVFGGMYVVEISDGVGVKEQVPVATPASNGACVQI